MIVPPDQAGPPIPTDDIERGEPGERASGGERAILIAVGIVLLLLFACLIVLPHSPVAAEW
jgi:hypothetical protein